MNKAEALELGLGLTVAASADEDVVAVVLEGLDLGYREAVRAMAARLLAQCERVDQVEAALRGQAEERGE